MHSYTATFSIPVQVATKTINKPSLAFSRLYLHSYLIAPYVPILASQHVLKLYLCHSVYIARCVIQLKCKYMYIRGATQTAR